jgi:CheY-like chemotaxis protein
VACNGGYVLVIDDDAAVQRTLVDILSDDYGHNVRIAADGCEALGVLRDSPPPALILVDLMMPLMDGAASRRCSRSSRSRSTWTICCRSSIATADHPRLDAARRALMFAPEVQDEVLCVWERPLPLRQGRSLYVSKQLPRVRAEEGGEKGR